MLEKASKSTTGIEDDISPLAHFEHDASSGPLLGYGDNPLPDRTVPVVSLSDAPFTTVGTTPLTSMCEDPYHTMIGLLAPRPPLGLVRQGVPLLSFLL